MMKTPPRGSSPSSNTMHTLGPSKSFPRGCLLLTRSGKRKSVRWLPDKSIKQVKEFDSTLDERTNVYRDAMQASQAKSLFENKGAEGHAFLHNKEPFDCASGQQQTPTIPLVPWSLIRIDLPTSILLVEPGSQSSEKLTQMERQKNSLPDLFLSKELVPPSPKEPDDLIVPNSSNPKVIPMDDVENPGLINDYSTSDWPQPRLLPLSSASLSSAASPPSCYMPSTVNVIDHNHGHGDLNLQSSHLQPNIHSQSMASAPPASCAPYGQPLVSSSYSSPNVFVNSSYNFYNNQPQPHQQNANAPGHFQAASRVVSSYYFNHSPAPHPSECPKMDSEGKCVSLNG